MKKNLYSIFSLVILTGFLFFVLLPAGTAVAISGVADDINTQLRPIQEVYGTDTSSTSLAQSIARIIQAVLGFLGVIFIVLIVYAGFTWMTAAGNEEKIKKAKDIMVAATIGAAICLGAYAITYFVINSLLEATGVSRGGL